MRVEQRDDLSSLGDPGACHCVRETPRQCRTGFENYVLTAREAAAILARLDCSRRDPVARILLGGQPTRPAGVGRLIVVWLAVAIIMFVPPILIGLVSGHSLTASDGTMKLPYLLDINGMMLFLVSLPIVAVAHVRQVSLFPCLLSQLAEDGIAQWGANAARRFVAEAERFFGSANTWGLVVGVVAASIVILMNHTALTENHGRSWQTAGVPPGQFNSLGWWFLLVQMGGFWFMLFHHLVHMVGGVQILRKYANQAAALNVNPLHPDRVGGLGPVARIGIQNQVVVAALGINVGSLFIVLRMLGQGATIWIAVVATAAYLVATPIVFFGPLVPFRAHMLRSKSHYLRTMADRFREDLDQMFSRLRHGEVARDGLEKLERLSNVHDRVAKLPEWPLDTSTLRKFAAAVLSPLISVAVSWAFMRLVEGL